MTRGWRIIRIETSDGRIRTGAVPPGESHILLLDAPSSLVALDGRLAERVPAATEQVECDIETLAPATGRLLVPIEAEEIWCAGVTYERSRDARIEESAINARDVYALAYEAERPELFLKDAGGRRTVGPGARIGVRSDAAWTVPEPELAVVVGRGGVPVGITAGNDVSSRDIEGANPLYLPQAKIFAGGCALGPAVLVPDDWDAPFAIGLRVLDPERRVMFEGETSTARMRRTLPELIAFLLRDNPVPPGSVLLTGTGIVPPDDFTLEAGHVVEVRVEGVGTLRNVVARAGEILVARDLGR